jgi:hypothetical protein
VFSKIDKAGPEFVLILTDLKVELKESSEVLFILCHPDANPFWALWIARRAEPSKPFQIVSRSE